MTQSIFWLQVTAQGFASVIQDTEDLSTIRGGSYLLRDGPRQVPGWLQEIPGVDFVTATIGGSKGIWRIVAEADVARDAAQTIRKKLQSNRHRHAHYSVALIAGSDVDTGDFSSVKQRLDAVAAMHQLTENRVAYPALEKNAIGICPVDLVRPVPASGTTQRHPDGNYAVSRSVADRRRFGMDQKQRIIPDVTAPDVLSDAAQELIGADPQKTRPFALQIASISEISAPPKALRRGLRDKIAVIHLDGNGFGKIQKAFLAASNTIESQKAFDDGLQAAMGLLIAEALNCVVENGGVGAPVEAESLVRQELAGAVEQVIRFEALLWGGDEVTFIVPARLGWAVAQTIADTSTDLSLTIDDGATFPLRFAVGLVFCHHTAPISRIRSVADDLSGAAKSKVPDATGKGVVDGREHTRFSAFVMESFDHTGGDTEGAFIIRSPQSERIRPPMTQADGHSLKTVDFAKGYFTLSTSELSILHDIAHRMRSDGTHNGPLSRSFLRRLARTVQMESGHGSKSYENLLSEGESILGSVELEMEESFFSGGKDGLWQGRIWRLLEEYWDYLIPEVARPKGFLEAAE